MLYDKHSYSLAYPTKLLLKSQSQSFFMSRFNSHQNKLNQTLLNYRKENGKDPDIGDIT
jgi:hypothetical protein